MILWRNIQLENIIQKWKKIIGIALIVGCLVCCIVLFKAYTQGKFNSVQSLQIYIKGFGVFAPIILMIIQAMQVVIPVLPGFLGCAVGAILFGTWGGFICNYIGISAGSIIAFLLARCYGKRLVEKLFPKDKYKKWSDWVAQSKSYTALLFVGIILPLFPDDFFCYFTGLTKMSARKFIFIIILGKPWCILVYSLLFGAAV